MAEIRTKCPNCGKKYGVDEEEIGCQIECLRCNKVFTIVPLIKLPVTSAKPPGNQPQPTLQAPPQPQSQAEPLLVLASPKEEAEAAEEPALTAPELVIAGLGLILVRIQPEPFIQGADEAGTDEYPPHRVELTKPYYMGKFPVTQQEYLHVTGTNPGIFQNPNHPVENVTWAEAGEFCRKLTMRERKAMRIPENYAFRLPTEAEWEYCCRAIPSAAVGGSVPGASVADKALAPAAEFSFGDYPKLLGDYAWYEANSGRATHPVGQKNPNGFKLYDLHGNVGEWCQDWLAPYTPEVARDPAGPAQGIRRVRRGGCWASIARNCRSARRIGVHPDCRSPLLGFRVVLAAEMVKPIVVNPPGRG